MSLLDSLGGGRRPLLVVVVLAGLGAMWGFGAWATAPAWVPLVQDVELETVSRVTAQLDEVGIAYKLETGGTRVVVEEADLARARVVLAGSGLTLGGRPGFELFDQPSWGMTDFTQRVNYRRALEGELERTLGRMRGVEEAQVHMALEESSLIRRASRPAEASIVLTLGRGAGFDAAMVEGVQALVAGSVEGLNTDNVTVMDDTGRLLSAPSGPGGMASSARQLDMRQRVEDYLEEKAQALLDRIVGSEDATVRVAAELDFDRLDRTVQSVDPESQVTVEEELAEVIPGDASQGASSVESSSTFETSRSVETLSREGGRITRLSVAVLLNDRAEEDGPWQAEELARIQALVQNAVGFDPARGDVISVNAVPFDPAPATPGAEPAPPPGILEWVRVLQRPVLGLLGAVVTLVLVLRLLGQLKTQGPSGGGRLAAAGEAPSLAPGQGRAEGEADTGQEEGRAAPRQIAQPSPVEVERPEMTARVVRAWLKEA